MTDQNAPERAPHKTPHDASAQAPQDAPQTARTEEDAIDEIMASIMESISRDEPSPVDGVRQAVVQQPTPLDYDVYSYDDKPAVILGAGMAATSGMGDRMPPYQGEVPTSDEVDAAAQEFETYQTQQFQQVQQVQQAQQAQNDPFDQPISPETTSQLPAVNDLPPAAPVMPAPVMPAPGSDPYADAQLSKPFIPLQEGEGGYQVGFDFGERTPSKWLTVFPFVLHVLAGAGVAGYIYYFFAMSQKPVSPIASAQFMYTLYALGAVIGVGVVLGLLVGIISRVTSKERGWIASGLGRAGVSTLICIVFWVAAMLLAGSAATGTLSF